MHYLGEKMKDAEVSPIRHDNLHLEGKVPSRDIIYRVYTCIYILYILYTSNIYVIFFDHHSVRTHSRDSFPVLSVSEAQFPLFD